MKKMMVLIGNYGSGKSELALNFAFQAAARGERTELLDLDMVNTYFRLTERGKQVEMKEIRLVSPNFANSGIETLSLPAEVASAFAMDWDTVIFDVGGDAVGSTALGRYHEDFMALEDGALEVLNVVNIRRPLAGTVEKIIRLQEEMQVHSRLKITGMINNSASGDTPRRTLSVANYEGGTWTTGESSLLPSGQGVYMVKMGNNITATLPVMISVNRGKVDNANYGHNVFYRDGGEWKALLTNYVQENATQTSIAAGSFGAISDLSGAIYVWTGDDADNTGNYQVRLRKYDQEARAWSTVGGNTLPIGHDGGFESHLSLDIAIAPDGTPFVAFNNFKDGKKLYVMYLDPDTRQWTAAQQLAEGADDVNIAFSSTGEGYITYTDGDNKIHIFKYAERQ